MNLSSILSHFLLLACKEKKKMVRQNLFVNIMNFKPKWNYFAGRDPAVLEKLGNWKVLYETVIVAWIIFGLGYVIMIINIIADGLKAPAKKIARKIHKTEKAIYAKVLQELILIKSKVNTTKGGLVWMAAHSVEVWKIFCHCSFQLLRFYTQQLFFNKIDFT